MKILVISDTHGSLTSWKKVIPLLQGVDTVIHVGDVLYHGPRNPIPEGYAPMELAEEIKKCQVPMYLVRGNCDAEVDLMVLDKEAQETLKLSIGGVRIFAHHGHQLDDDDLLAFVRGEGQGLIISGHTHIPRLEMKQDNIFLNPGSTTMPKDGQGPTVAFVTDNSVEIIDLESGSVRSQINF